jgi:hypothetical protein
MVTTHRWNLRLPAVFGHADITPELLALVGQSGVGTGILTICAPRSSRPASRYRWWTEPLRWGPGSR